MRRYRTVIILLLLIVVPLAVAVVAARFLLPGDAGKTAQSPTEPAVAAAPPSAKETERRSVIAAARALPVGTLLAEMDLIEMDIDADGLQSAHILVDERMTPAALRGHAVREPVAAGTPLTWSAIVGPGQRGFLAAALGPGTRAVTIRLGEGARFAGLIDPGDRVDVILTAKLRLLDGTDTVVARTILEDVRVVAVDRRVLSTVVSAGGEEKVTRGEIVTATLEVSPEEANRLALGEREGTLALAVRSLEATRSGRGRTMLMKELISPPVVKTAPEKPPAPPALSMVLLAAGELPAGTLLRAEHLRGIALPPSEIRQGEILADARGVDALSGYAVREPLAAGTRLTWSALLAPGQRGFLAAVLKPGTRAMTIRLGEAARQAGLIGAGDRVDVILTAETTGDGSSPRVLTRRIVEDVRVVAIDLPGPKRPALPADGQADPAKALTATLEVSPSQADRLALGQREGTLSLAVRSRGEASDQGASRGTVDLSDLLSLPGEKEKDAGDLEPATEEIESPRSETQQSVLAPEKKVLVIRGSEHTEHIFLPPGANRGLGDTGGSIAGPRQEGRRNRGGSRPEGDRAVVPE
ncbi:MAG: Flp pilus assembly protein CpaB [Defluviicoccus sp.]|nr:Flp pilus assembly protein CpaB [Defluviicoccus sp.]MDE0382485.1 Flp pilus assembly protein CpaB [Defluviicoccus sp.]